MSPQVLDEIHSECFSICSAWKGIVWIANGRWKWIGSNPDRISVHNFLLLNKSLRSAGLRMSAHQFKYIADKFIGIRKAYNFQVICFLSSNKMRMFKSVVGRLHFIVWRLIHFNPISVVHVHGWMMNCCLFFVCCRTNSDGGLMTSTGCLFVCLSQIMDQHWSHYAMITFLEHNLDRHLCVHKLTIVATNFYTATAPSRPRAYANEYESVSILFLISQISNFKKKTKTEKMAKDNNKSIRLMFSSSLL